MQWLTSAHGQSEVWNRGAKMWSDTYHVSHCLPYMKGEGSTMSSLWIENRRVDLFMMD